MKYLTAYTYKLNQGIITVSLCCYERLKGCIMKPDVLQELHNVTATCLSASDREWKEDSCRGRYSLIHSGGGVLLIVHISEHLCR